MPVNPIETDRNAAPARMRVIMHVVLVAPATLSVNEAHVRVPLRADNKSAPRTPTAAASVGVAIPA